MKASTGDWLVIETGNLGRVAREGLIEEVRSPTGEPPFLVRWSDTGREALIFPGPDAHVVGKQDFAARCAARAARAVRNQQSILTH